MHDDSHRSAQETLERTGSAAHGGCFLCGRVNPLGLQLVFRALDDATVTATFPGGHVFEGYPGMLHGGLMAALLDAAMTNRLFSSGVTAVTGSLRVRYHAPARPEQPVTVSASIERARPPLYRLAAELRQGSLVVASATASFFELGRGTGAAAARPRPRDRGGAARRRRGRAA